MDSNSKLNKLSNHAEYIKKRIDLILSKSKSYVSIELLFTLQTHERQITAANNKFNLTSIEKDGFFEKWQDKFKEIEKDIQKAEEEIKLFDELNRLSETIEYSVIIRKYDYLSYITLLLIGIVVFLAIYYITYFFSLKGFENAGGGETFNIVSNITIKLSTFFLSIWAVRFLALLHKAYIRQRAKYEQKMMAVKTLSKVGIYGNLDERREAILRIINMMVKEDNFFHDSFQAKNRINEKKIVRTVERILKAASKK